MKEFLQENYAKKRGRARPARTSLGGGVSSGICFRGRGGGGWPAGSTSSTPEARALQSLLGDSAPALHLNQGTPSRSPAAGPSQGRQREKKQCDLDVILARPQLHTQQLQPILLTLHISTVMQLRFCKCRFCNLSCIWTVEWFESFCTMFPHSETLSFSAPNYRWKCWISKCSFRSF